MKLSLRLGLKISLLALITIVLAKVDTVIVQLYDGPGVLFPIAYTFLFFRAKFSYARWAYCAVLVIVYGLLFGYALIYMLLLLVVTMLFEWAIMGFAQRFSLTLVLFFGALVMGLVFGIFVTTPWLLHVYDWFIPQMMLFPSLRDTILYSITVELGVLLTYPLLQKSESQYTLFMKQPYDF